MTGRFTIVKDPKVSKAVPSNAGLGSNNYFRKIDFVPDVEIDLSCPETLSDIDEDGNEENCIYGEYRLSVGKPFDLNLDYGADLPSKDESEGNKQPEGAYNTGQADSQDEASTSHVNELDKNFNIDWQEDSDPFVWPDLEEEEIFGIDLSPTENFTVLLEHPKSKFPTEEDKAQIEVQADQGPKSVDAAVKEDGDDNFAIVPDIDAQDDEKVVRDERDAAVNEESGEDEDDCCSIYDEDDTGPEEPERLLDSCYVGDHIVPYLEE